MRLKNLAILSSSVLLVFILIACRPVDLTPEGLPNLSGAISYCRIQNGDLIVTVRNLGTGNAPASTTIVEFLPGGTFSLPTPAIPAGGSVNLAPLDIPGRCFNPDCDFKITVDASNIIQESNETNNSAEGICLG